MNIIQRLRGDMETERLYLRHWEQKDFKDFCEFIGDPEVMLPAGSRPAKTMDEAAAELRRAMHDPECYAIVLKSEEKAIGKIRFQSDAHRQNYAGSRSVSYHLNKSYWGNGYMPEALCAMISYAFEKKKLPVLGISHFSTNIRSRRVIEKCGFRLEGTIRCAYRRFDGEYFDDVCYSILRDEYFEGRQKLLEG